ncbi:MAG: hypothetical protein K0Q68_547 [Moraxellaceae bacterium]|jgi:WS/DGAT/MGAT family acyltransferase|nr:hypothetical protein [Moraxellaceae bacterium]
MQQLTNLDASFLHLENDHSPMHVGGVLIFDAPARGRMSLERVREHVFTRLQTARVFRQRLAMAPLHLDAPWWVEDEHFCLDHHLRRETVQAPLDLAGLETLSAEFFSKPLRRDRPLWELLYVESGEGHRTRQGGAFALLLKVHHAALDGVSAEAVISGLLDLEATPRPLPADTWTPEPMPGQAAMVWHRLFTATGWREQAQELSRSGLQLGRRFLQRLADPEERTLLPHWFTAPHTPFNVPVSARRVYCTAELSMARIRQIRRHMHGLTVNDVVLAVCAGAVRRYLADDGALPARSLVGMAPVSKRNHDEKHALGNKVSAMLIRLATDIEDPLMRLRQIHQNASCAKAYSREMTVEALFDQLPHAATAHFLSRYSQGNRARQLPPMFNLVITNVPGSPVPLYLDGAPMRSFSGMVGVFDGMALSLVVLSYGDTLSIAMTSAPEVLRDPQRLADYLADALDELEGAVRQVEMAFGPGEPLPARSLPPGARQEGPGNPLPTVG